MTGWKKDDPLRLKKDGQGLGRAFPGLRGLVVSIDDPTIVVVEFEGYLGKQSVCVEDLEFDPSTAPLKMRTLQHQRENEALAKALERGLKDSRETSTVPTICIDEIDAKIGKPN